MKILCIADEIKEDLNGIKGDLMRKHASESVTWDFVLSELIDVYRYDAENKRGGKCDKKRIQKP